MENNYDFRRRMLEVHRPDRRRYDLVPKACEVEIDGSWCIVIPHDADIVIYNAARDLEDYFFVSMGISLKITCEAAEFSIVYETDESLEENSYRFTVSASRVTLCGSDPRAAAQAGYFIEDIMNLAEAPFLEITDTVRRPLYSPRMIHSGFGLDMYPDEHISAIAHAGISALLIFVVDIDKTPHGYTDFNDLIYRASRLGVDVYAYSYMKSRVHPDDEGAESFYDGLYGRLFDRCPGLRGIVFVGESCEFPSRDTHTTGLLRLDNINPDGTPKITGKPSPGWWPCCDFPQWIELIKRIIRSRRPDADIVFWTYNWGYVEEKYRLELLQNIPCDISLLVTFEMFEDVEREGVTSRTVDYTLFFEGPGKYFVSEAVLAAERGIRLYSMTNTGGLTWDIGTIPYEPAPYQWARRHAEMKKAHDKWGLCGIMDSHHFGFYPSFISELAKWSFTEPSPDAGTVLSRIAARDWGEENIPAVLRAYELFSEGIRHLISTNEDQYGPFRVGPSYPLLLYKNNDAEFPSMPWAHHGGNKICNPVYSYDLSSPERYDKINYEIKCHAVTARLYNEGASILEGLCGSLTGRKKEEAERFIGLARFISDSAWTTVNVKEWHKLKTALQTETDPQKRAVIIAGLRETGEREIANAVSALPLVRADSRLGFEPSMEYMCDDGHLEWKLSLTRYAVNEELSALAEKLK
jgi:hypothetical protein